MQVIVFINATPLVFCSTASVRSISARSSSIGVVPVAQPWEQINSTKTKTKRWFSFCYDAHVVRKHRVGALSMSARSSSSGVMPAV